jgi:lipopolysaccharide transport system ATP-binding protein
MEEKDLVLKIENISKQYRLGLVGSGTLHEDLKRWWYRVRGKEDPFLKIGAENDRSKKTDDKFVWALKDINFEVKKGEVLGIIGKNGAGKSTLLKLLSKVADPTTGSIKYKGRIAALLEVGTGFHPELTGRENIFLNGAVLGMQKEEIALKVDEIIEFSGVAQYIDTPVKRYSSGMKVRLGFSVAAHLEPDILIVDEVLAVGDAEFQKKCIGKMQDVAGEGRTVLFVSHNMNSVSRLCNKGIVLENGKVIFSGSVHDSIETYLKTGESDLCGSYFPKKQEGSEIELVSAELKNLNNEIIALPVDVLSDFIVDYKVVFNKYVRLPVLSLTIRNHKEEVVFFSDRLDDETSFTPQELGTYLIKVTFPQPLLKPGKYDVSFGIRNKENVESNHFRSVLHFELIDLAGVRENRGGYIYKPLAWEVIKC